MRIILSLASDRAIHESLRASLASTDLLLSETTLEEGMRRLVTIQADAIILDDASGLGLHALKTLVEAFPNLPIIILSSRSDLECLASYTLAGARHCLVKPFKQEEFNSALDSCLDQRLATSAERPEVLRVATEHAAVNQHQMAMRWMSRNTTYLEDPMQLTHSLVEAIVDIFGASRAGVLLNTNGAVRVVASHGIPGNVVEPLRLTFTGGLMRWLEENACLIDRRANDDAREAVKELQVLGARMALPLISCGRLCGAVLVGEKASGLDYSFDERELLTVIARCASSCLEKARHYRDLSRRQNRLDTVLSSLTAGVVTVRTDKTVSMMNESAERILQLRADDVLGRSVQKLGSQFADIVLRTLSENEPRLRQQIHDIAINETLGLSVTPLGSEGVAVIFTILHTESAEEEDITYSPIWEFLASRVAQEIKNPLVAVNTFAQLLPRKYDSQEFREDFSQVVQAEVARINAVVETLFEFAQHPRLNLTERNLNEIVQDIFAGLQDDLKARDILLETDFINEPLDVRLDQAEFKKAVGSVVQNSFEAMPKGGTLKVVTRLENGDCELIIADSGPGVSDQDASLIFRPFFSTKEKGMGLGLTLANRILLQHEGNLRALPNRKEGSAFAFKLPSARAARP